MTMPAAPPTPSPTIQTTPAQAYQQFSESQPFVTQGGMVEIRSNDGRISEMVPADKVQQAIMERAQQGQQFHSVSVGEAQSIYGELGGQTEADKLRYAQERGKFIREQTEQEIASKSAYQPGVSQQGAPSLSTPTKPSAFQNYLSSTLFGSNKSFTDYLRENPQTPRYRIQESLDIVQQPGFNQMTGAAIPAIVKATSKLMDTQTGRALTSEEKNVTITPEMEKFVSVSDRKYDFSKVPELSSFFSETREKAQGAVKEAGFGEVMKQVGDNVQRFSVGNLQFFTTPQGAGAINALGNELVSTKEGVQRQVVTPSGEISSTPISETNFEIIKGIGAVPAGLGQSLIEKLQAQKSVAPTSTTTEVSFESLKQNPETREKALALEKQMNQDFQSEISSYAKRFPNYEALEKEMGEQKEFTFAKSYSLDTSKGTLTFNVSAPIKFKEAYELATRDQPGSFWLTKTLQDIGVPSDFTKGISSALGATSPTMKKLSTEISSAPFEIKPIKSMAELPVAGAIQSAYQKSDTYARITMARSKKGLPVQDSPELAAFNPVWNIPVATFEAYSAGTFIGSAIVAAPAVGATVASIPSLGLKGTLSMAKNIGAEAYNVLTKPIYSETVGMVGALAGKNQVGKFISGAAQIAGGIEKGANVAGLVGATQITVEKSLGSKATFAESIPVYGELGRGKIIGIQQNALAFAGAAPMSQQISAIEGFSLYNLPYYGLKAGASFIPSTAAFKLNAKTNVPLSKVPDIAYTGLNVAATGFITKKYMDQGLKPLEAISAGGVDLALYDVYLESFGPDIAWKKVPGVGEEASAARELRMIDAGKLSAGNFASRIAKNAEIGTVTGGRGLKFDIKIDVPAMKFDIKPETQKTDITSKQDFKPDVKSDLRFDVTKTDFKVDLKPDYKVDLRQDYKPDMRPDLKTDFKPDFKPDIAKIDFKLDLKTDYKTDLKDDPSKVDYGKMDFQFPTDIPGAIIPPLGGGGGGGGGSGRQGKTTEGRLRSALEAFESTSTGRFSFKEPTITKIKTPKPVKISPTKKRR